MKVICSTLALYLGLLGATASAAPITYTFNGDFERWWGLRTSEKGPYTGAFGGSFTIDTTTDTITDYDISMDLRYTGGTIGTITFDGSSSRSNTALSATSATFWYSYRWSSSPLQNRIRLYLDDTSNWGDRTVTLDRVWGDVDTKSINGFVGTSPHNNDTGADPVAITAVTAVPLPASLPLMAAGLGLLGLLRRKR